MSKKKTSVGGIIAGSVATVLLLGLLGGIAYKSEGFRNWNVKEWFNVSENNDNASNTSEDGTETTVESNGANIELLASITNLDGSITNTYSYSLTNSGNSATRDDVTATLGWSDNQVDENISTYLTATLDKTNHTFSITKKADFSHQAQYNLRSVSNSNIGATVYIDCAQKFLGFNNVSTKIVDVDLEDDDADLVDYIENDLLTYIGANNLSSTYTIARSYPSSTVVQDFHLVGYITETSQGWEDVNYSSQLFGDFDLDSSNIDNDNLVLTFTLEDLQDLAMAESNFMSEALMSSLESNTGFGVKAELTTVTIVDGKSKTLTTTINMTSPIANIDFGTIPDSISVETSEIVF